MPNNTPVRYLTVSMVWLLAVSLLTGTTACTQTHALNLKIDTAHVEGRQYAPRELTRMMTELGYQQLRIEDPVTGQSVSVAEKNGEYRLLFQSLENNNIRVDIHAGMTDNRIAMYFYDINQTALGPSALRLFEQLNQRARQEFGTQHVRVGRP